MGNGSGRPRLYEAGERLAGRRLDLDDTDLMVVRLAPVRHLRIRAELMGIGIRALVRLAGCSGRSEAGKR